MHPTMTEIAPGDRPREKLQQNGVAALGDNELLAVLIGHGTRGVTSLALANEVLALASGVHGLTRLHPRQLARVPGIGPVQASRVLAAVELGRRTLLTAARERPRFLQPRDAAAYLLPRYGAFPVERFGVALVDTRSRLLATRLLSVGSLDTSVGNPREVFREALLAGAGGVVVFHNHPSGDATPSRDDIALTLRLRRAGVLVGIDLIDHVILADTQFCSLREAGVL
jgi:DNA repair protein RadC